VRSANDHTRDELRALADIVGMVKRQILHLEEEVFRRKGGNGKAA
jgi:hypothetical protein